MSLKVVEGEKIPNIEIEYAHLNQHAAFRTALGKVFRDPNLPQKTAYWFGRVYKELNKKLQTIGEEYQKLVLEFAEKDADGNLTPAQVPGSVNIVKDKQAEFEAKKAEFEKNVLKLDLPKMNARDFMTVKLSAEDLQALEPIFYGLE